MVAGRIVRSGRKELALELEPARHPASLFEQRVAHAREHLDIADTTPALRRTLAMNREAATYGDHAAVEEHL